MRMLTASVSRCTPVFLLVLLFAASDARAQISMPADMSPGVRAALHLNQLHGDAVIDPQPEARPGIGLFVNYRFDPRFAIQPEVLYSRRSTSAAASTIRPHARGVRFDMDYIDVPVLFKAFLPQQGSAEPHLVLGPAVSFKVSGDAFDQNLMMTDLKLKDELSSTAFGVVLGGGMELFDGRRTLSTDVRYVIGLTNLLGSSDLPGFRHRGMTLTLGVGL
jgi:hypothetical protein